MLECKVIFDEYKNQVQFIVNNGTDDVIIAFLEGKQWGEFSMDNYPEPLDLLDFTAREE